MKIGVVGLGFVGLSLTSVLSSKGYDVIGVDTDKEKCIKINNFEMPFFEPDLEKILKNGFRKKLTVTNDFLSLKNCDIIFITVGTPQKSNGEIQLSMIKSATREIGKIIKNSKKNPIIFLKSTVIPGVAKNTVSTILEKVSGKKAGKDFGLISNPEFLQETTAIRDTKFPHVIILGGDKTKFMTKAKNFLAKLHPGVPIIVTNHQTAEIIKYANNSFLATKISFINQLSNICQNIPGANVDDVASAIGLDPRIGKLFLNAGPGYGGSCLPKDVKAIMNFSSKAGVSPTFLSAVEKINQQQIENILKIIKNACGNIKNKKITVLGLAFKPFTDDIRDSSSLKIIKELLKNKAKVTVHDPMAMENARIKFKDTIIYENSMSGALKDSNCGIIMTAWPEYSKIQNKNLKNMKKKIIIDSRRILKNSKLDCVYIALGIGK